MAADWTSRRTCSRVSSGPCERCKKQTFFSAYVNKRAVLCRTCYEELFAPEVAAERKASAQAAEEKRRADLELALKGELPGAMITKSGAVFGPPGTFMGLPAHQVLREGLYDTEPFESDKPGLVEAFKAFGKFVNFDTFEKPGEKKFGKDVSD